MLKELQEILARSSEERLNPKHDRHKTPDEENEREI